MSNDEWNDEDTDKMKEAGVLLQDPEVSDLFNGYYYDRTLEFPKAHFKKK